MVRYQVCLVHTNLQLHTVAGGRADGHSRHSNVPYSEELAFAHCRLLRGLGHTEPLINFGFVFDSGMFVLR